ncbi:MAG: 3-phosphoserine/phosphohydroxythreonine transaminase [Bacteroidia bacterium]|nr:3-phosphoserine/phosphohydroxythreonine transaminase [Bacteroidia bacterium]MCC6767582.1 3-phosphoserine/phosphohydroxythreonine transaminase [Bacteroidia bacterium]
MKKHNFSAGPGILPAEVLQKAAEACINFNQYGLSLLEISHRGKNVIEVFDRAEALVKKLLGLGDDYRVIFLQGGASSQFAMVPANFLNTKAAYLNTGVWANRAVKEARFYGETEVVASSEAENFNFIPKNYQIPANADYFHITSNNTIYGTQMHSFPESPVPLICDMSSDIFSHRFDATKFDMIYAGVQKNMGPAGATMVVLKKEMLDRITRKLPTMQNYRTHVDADSMYNTPPVFAVYVSMLTLEWLERNGGIEWAEKRNAAKAECFYNELDRNSMFRGTVAKEDRSWMNANFVLNNPEKESTFSDMLKEAGIIGLAGHRSVGGFRASMYNAMELDSVKVLTDVMKSFEQKHA